MHILIPRNPDSTPRPSTAVRWLLDFNWDRKGLGKFRHSEIYLYLSTRFFTFKLTRSWPTSDFPGPVFVRPTRYTQRFIVHPNGGSAARLVCEECGADYPMPSGPHAYPCANCAVRKESGIKLRASEWWRWRVRPRFTCRIIRAPHVSSLHKYSGTLVIWMGLVGVHLAYHGPCFSSVRRETGIRIGYAPLGLGEGEMIPHREWMRYEDPEIVTHRTPTSTDSTERPDSL